MITARSAARRAAGAMQKMKGKAEQVAGRAAGDDRLHARGLLDHTVANVKHAGARVREAGERAAHKLPARVRGPGR